MKLVVGLGNPGPKYQGTRHNVGFDTVEQVAKRGSGGAWKSRFSGEVVEVTCGSERLLLLKPFTYMNLSGKAVKEALTFFKLFPEEVLVICDDMNLPLGKIRLKGSGSSGGQKGLQNTIDQLGTDAVPRLRLGVGRPPESVDPANYVLQRFSKSEERLAQEMVDMAAEVVEAWSTQGIVLTMNRYNGGGA